MTLAILGFGMVATFMALIMTKRLTPMVALIVVPIVFALIGGFAPNLGPMMIDGIKTLAPTGVMLLFAILFFSLMTDTGLFDPLVGVIVRLAGGDPLKICLGTVALGALISLDGDGSTTYIICCAAFLPLYGRLGMNRLHLTGLLMLTSGVMNLTPWGGPTARAASALHLDVGEVFLPLIPAMLAGLAFVFAMAFILGRRERARLGRIEIAEPEEFAEVIVSQHEEARRPKLIWINAALTLGLLVCLVMGVLPLPVLMMLATAIALMVNYPHIASQKERIAAHAGSALAVASLIFAAGIFTGILSGTGMVEAMGRSVTGAIPPALGPYMAPITAALSLPFTFFISNDAFYFGVLPVLAQTGAHYGVAPIEIARASLMGAPFHLLSPLVPSTYLLVSLAGVELGDHQKSTGLWAVGACLALSLGAIAVGAFGLG
jgi:CitMHS family citrate-Mg2+:H+ or citrate-Ca2+:H+ symporter